MPLILELKPGDKIIVNGAVLENAGGNTRLSLHNEAALLRQKEVLAEEDASTPAARVYFNLQCAYVFPQHRDDYLKIFHRYLGDFVTAVPGAKPIGDKIAGFVENGQYYKGLKEAQKLIQRESEILGRFHQELERAMDDEDDAAAKAQAGD